jgi:hypothetical protein
MRFWYRSSFGPRRTTPTATRSPFPFTPPAVFADMPRIIRPTFSFPLLNSFLRGF